MTRLPSSWPLAVPRIRGTAQATRRATAKANRGKGGPRYVLKSFTLQTLSLALPLAAAGCTSVPLKPAGTLATYSKLSEQKGWLSKSRNYLDGNALAAAKTVRVFPTTFSTSAWSRVKSQRDRELVANALDREICIALSDRFRIVSPSEAPDLTVRAVVTDIVPTDKAVAGVSTVVTLGSKAVLPVSIPRLPFGLGGLAVEAEAIDARGVQRAAIVWARGANSISNKPRVSEVGDAYSLATKFASEFSRMIVIGKEPPKLDITLPSGQRVKSWLGGKPKYVACDAFGRAPGLLGAVGEKFGAPPEWTDRRPQAGGQ